MRAIAASQMRACRSAIVPVSSSSSSSSWDGSGGGGREPTSVPSGFSQRQCPGPPSSR
jgi:hypothetical protein